MRQVKRNTKFHRAQSLFDASLQGNLELFKEIKRVVNGKSDVNDLPETVDGATGVDEIAGKFKEVYEKLYTSSDSSEGMREIDEKIKDLLKVESSDEVEKMTTSVVKEAAMKMKSNKMDVSQGYSSECLKNAPTCLFENLSLVFRTWLYHGKVTSSILVCAFLPLIKSNLKDPAASESYRALGGSSLILKLFESCIISIWGDKLNSDTLQFGFKKNCSTGTASWMVHEVLQHYLRQGSKPVLVVLDCTKAFDLARFDILFGRLLERLPAVVVRVLPYSYKEQLA